LSWVKEESRNGNQTGDPVAGSIRLVTSLLSNFFSGRWELSYLFEKALQVLGSHRILQFGYRFSFNLAYSLASHFEDPSHFLKSVGIAIGQAVAKPYDFTLAVGQSFQ
jgi:hypothetical protein